MAGVRSLLIDIDGVLVVSWRAIPGAAAALTRCRAAGLDLRFLTNTTSISRAGIAERLNGAGMSVQEDEIFSAPAATASWLRTNRAEARCYLINSGDLGHDLDGVDFVGSDEVADIIVLGGAGPEFSYEQMNHALSSLLSGAELVGMHRNLYWRTADGFSLDTGAYLAALEQSAQVKATVLGKPSPDFFATAIRDMDRSANEVAMVGDDIENDVLAAQAIGCSGVLVQTGKYRPEAVRKASGKPDSKIESFASLPNLLGLP